MRRLSAALVPIAILFPVLALAQPDCAALEKAWVDAERIIAMESSGYIGDDSAPRATMRAVNVGNAIATQNGNLRLMQMEKCPPPPTPVGDFRRFSKAAMNCGIARIDFRATNNVPTPPQCKSWEWAPDMTDGKK